MMSNIEKYFKGASNEPMILWGTSGCGKTSVLAKAYSMVPQWCPVKASPVMILRFLGTSPDSSTIVPMLTSISRQICHNYDKPADDMPTELSPLVQYFKKLLSIASKNKPLVIFLDSLDQLSAADGAHSLAWFPISMPPHVKCVVSTLPDYYGIMDTMKKMIYTKDNYIEILPLGTELACTVLKAWLAKNKRTVSEPQWVIVKEALEKCNLPLYIKLVYDEITRWKSYTPPDLTSLAHTIHDSIIKLFKRVENKHGKILVMHALSYLTASKSGLSEAELEDLLSCDEIVLNDVYQYHLPPVRRIPPLLWTRIRNDMPGYLSEREADGVNVINWYHRQFIEASKERYFRNQNFVMDHHSQIADYFIGMWGGGKAKPFEYSELQRQRFFLSESTGECDRKCPEQPLFFTDSNGQVMRFNLRKLSELPFHLVRSKRWDDLYKGCLFNFKWLHAKLCSLPLQTIIADFEDAHETLPDKEVLLVVDALRLSASVISKHPDMLGPQIVGRLLPYFHTHLKIQYLIKQCDDDGLSVNALDPSYHCLATPGGPLQYSLEGHPFAPFGLGITSDARYLVSVSNMFIIWDMSTGDVFRQISPGIQGIMQNLCISPDDKYAISYTNNDQIIICNIMTGDTKLLDKPVDDVETISGTTVNKTQLAVWTNKKWYLYSLKGELIDKGSEEKMNLAIIHVHLSNSAEDNCRYLVWRTQQPIPGVETDEDMTLQIINDDTEDFYFHSAIAISADRRTLYACIAISDAAVACYQKKGNEWKYDRTLGDNFDNIFCLTFDPDERYLVGTVALGYKLWDLSNDQKLDLKLPTGLRNIPNKNPLVSTIVFTRESEYCVAGVRNNIYVWSRKTGDLIKTLDAHFGRIIGMRSVVTMDANKVVSASIDKSIKIWNFNNILEDAFSIARHEKPIDQLSLASHAYIGATTTRNCVGIWNLESGKLEKTLRQSGSAIVTHAAITPDAQYVVAAESGSIICWDVDKAKVVNAEQQKEVQQLMLCDDGTKSITVSKLVSTKCRLVCRTIPNGEIVYQFDYNINTFKSAVITCDGLFLVVPSVGNKRQEHDVLSLYHAKTGTHMYDMNPKHPNLKEWEFLIAMPSDATHVALFDEEKGTVFDVKKKSFIRAVQKWQGVCTHNGRFGLYAPNRGGLELLDIKHGKVQHTLIPKVAEGVFSVKCLVTRNDQHVIYYHDGHRSIRVFRVSDGRQIADYRCPAEIRAMAGTQGGTSVVLGAVDGSVTVLTIADPKNKHNKSFLASLPSRNPEFHQPPEPDPSAATVTGAKAATTGKFQTVVQVARIAAKAKLATETKSRACVIC